MISYEGRNLFDQAEFDVRFEWGLPGLRALAPISDTIVIVDVLSFTTCVAIAVDRGAEVFPYPWRDESAIAFALSRGAELAVDRRHSSPARRFTLSPASMLEATSGTRLVLPSPNGSALSVAARTAKGLVLAGCLRNAAAVARAARGRGGTKAVIAAGERWGDDTLRPALEDLLGAGAILRELPDDRSPEAQIAVAAFESVGDRLAEVLMQTGSGRELSARGHDEDVALTSELDVTSTVPVLTGDAFVAYDPSHFENRI